VPCCPLSAGRREKRIEWQLLEIDEPPLAGTAGIPACNERFSAKTSSSNSTQGEAINSTPSLTKGFFAYRR
jgi:hypothetical protein